MPSKRKQQKKIKRELRRRAQRGSKKPVDGKQEKQNKSKSESEQEMMLKLLALMKGGSGATVTGMNTEQVLAMREQVAKAQSEAARRMKEASAAEAQAKTDTTTAKQDQQVAKAESDRDAAIAERDHTVKMNQLEAEREGLVGEQKLLTEQIREERHQIDIATAEGDIAKLRVVVDNMKNELQFLRQNINRRGKSGEMKTLYENYDKTLTDVLKSFKEIDSNFAARDVTAEEVKELQDKVIDLERMKPTIDKLKQQLLFEIQEQKDQRKDKENLRDGYLKARDENRDLERALELAKMENENAGMIQQRDADGNIIYVVDETKKLPEIDPEKDPEVVKLKKQLDHIINTLNDRVYKTTHWHDDLIKRPYSWWFHERSGDYDRNIQSATMKRVLDTEGIQVEGTSLEEIADWYAAGYNKYKEALKKAKQRAEEIKAHNTEVEKVKIALTERVTHDMVVKKETENQKLRDQIEMHKRGTARHNAMRNELEEKYEENQILKAQLEQTPVPVLTQDDIQKKATAEADRRKLERQQQEIDRKQQALDKLQQDTEELTNSNAVATARIDRMNNVKEFTANYRTIAEKYAEAERQKLLKEQQEMTWKAEHDMRKAKAEADAYGTARVEAADEKIKDEMVKRIIYEQEARRNEELRRKAEENREYKLSQEAMTTARQLLGSSSLSNAADCLNQQLDVIQKDIAYVHRAGDNIINYLTNNSAIGSEVVRYMKSARRDAADLYDVYGLRKFMQDRKGVNYIINKTNEYIKRAGGKGEDIFVIDEDLAATE